MEPKSRDVPTNYHNVHFSEESFRRTCEIVGQAVNAYKFGTISSSELNQDVEQINGTLEYTGLIGMPASTFHTLLRANVHEAGDDNNDDGYGVDTDERETTEGGFSAGTYAGLCILDDKNGIEVVHRILIYKREVDTALVEQTTRAYALVPLDKLELFDEQIAHPEQGDSARLIMSMRKLSKELKMHGVSELFRTRLVKTWDFFTNNDDFVTLPIQTRKDWMLDWLNHAIEANDVIHAEGPLIVVRESNEDKYHFVTPASDDPLPHVSGLYAGFVPMTSTRVVMQNGVPIVLQVQDREEIALAVDVSASESETRFAYLPLRSVSLDSFQSYR